MRKLGENGGFWFLSSGWDFFAEWLKFWDLKHFWRECSFLISDLRMRFFCRMVEILRFGTFLARMEVFDFWAPDEIFLQNGRNFEIWRNFGENETFWFLTSGWNFFAEWLKFWDLKQFWREWNFLISKLRMKFFCWMVEILRFEVFLARMEVFDFWAQDEIFLQNG